MDGENTQSSAKVPALGWIVVGAAIVAGIGVIDFLKGLARDYVDDVRHANDLYRDAADKFHDAVDKAAAADKARKEAEQKADKERKEADEAIEEAETAGKKAEEARPESDSPDEDGRWDSAACRRAMGGGRDIRDPAVMGKLKENWKELKSRWDRVSYPNPDADNTFTALDLPICGLDTPTTQGASAACKLPVDCPKAQLPNASCGCSTSSGSHRPIQQMQCATVRCADGSMPTAAGMICSCGANGDDAPNVGTRPPRPSPVAIDTFFAARKESTAPGRVMMDPMMR
jgi:hypothetical protein